MTPDAIAGLELLADARGRIAGKVALLGADEIDVVEMVIDGLVRGRAVYGELQVAIDNRDLAGEAAAELRDALIYSAAGLLRIRRGTP